MPLVKGTRPTALKEDYRPVASHCWSLYLQILLPQHSPPRPSIYPSIFSSTHSPITSFIHPSMYLSSYLFIYLPHSPTYLSILSIHPPSTIPNYPCIISIHYSIHPPTHLPIFPVIYSFVPFIHLSIHIMPIHPSIHPSIRPFTSLSHWFIKASTYLPIQVSIYSFIYSFIHFVIYLFIK